MNEVKTYTIDELKAKLTEKERLFCHQYIIEWNGAKAAREAGYSENTAKEIASENLTKPHIKQYIEYIRNRDEENAGLSKLYNLIKLKDIIADDQTQPREVISAISEANKMMGYSQNKIDLTGSINQVIKIGFSDETD